MKIFKEDKFEVHAIATFEGIELSIFRKAPFYHRHKATLNWQRGLIKESYELFEQRVRLEIKHLDFKCREWNEKQILMEKTLNIIEKQLQEKTQV